MSEKDLMFFMVLFMWIIVGVLLKEIDKLEAENSEISVENCKLILKNSELRKLQMNEDGKSKIIENNLKKIGFSNAKCIPQKNADEVTFGYDVYFETADSNLKRPVFVSVRGRVEFELVNLKPLHKTLFLDCDEIVDKYNKMLELYNKKERARG